MSDVRVRIIGETESIKRLPGVVPNWKMYSY